MKRSHRHTIMDGRVVTFASDFVEERKGIVAPIVDAVGPYEVSASRNAVMVHRASVSDLHSFNELNSAIQMAWEEHKFLRTHDGRPNDGDRGYPRDVE